MILRPNIESALLSPHLHQDATTTAAAQFGSIWPIYHALKSDHYMKKEKKNSQPQVSNCNRDSPTMIPLPHPQMLTAIASLLGAGAYLDAKYGVSHDLRKLRRDREQIKRIGERIRELGNEATLYRLLESADQGADALWFEGRSFTYGEMKRSKTLSPERINKFHDAS
jgi:hypothetical protein